MYICIYYVCIYTFCDAQLHRQVANIHVNVYIIYVHMYMCIYVYTHICVHMYL